MGGLKIVGGVVSLSLIVVLSQPGGLGRMSGLTYTTGPQQRTSGAKFVAVNPAPEAKEQSFIEYVFELAGIMSGSEERAGSDLDALKARQMAPAGEINFADLADRTRASMELAQEMGVAVGPTAFDSHWDKQDAAMDPIRRLDGN